MKRLLALLLCLTCLLGTLASCGNNEPTPPAETTPAPSEPSTPSTPSTPEDPADPSTPEDDGGEDTPADSITAHALADYTIVYPKDASVMLKNAVAAMAATINEALPQGQIAVISDDVATATKYEILVGETNRAASTAYYATPSAAEYTVRRVENNIVLAGFSEALTKQAITQFTEAYLASMKNGGIELVTDYTGNFLNAMTISSATANDVKIVYDASQNYLSSMSQTLAADLKSVIGTTLRRSAAGTTFDANTAEIMIGNFDFDGIAAVNEALWLDGYAIGIVGKKLVITASSEADYAKAIAAFEQMIATHAIKGQKQVVFPSDTFERVFSMELMSNLPYVAAQPKVVYPGGDGAYVVIFEDVKSTLFDSYVSALANNGFAKYAESQFNGTTRLQKNSFATYITDANSVDLGFHTAGYVGCGEEYSNGILYVTVTPREDLVLHNATTPDYTPVDATQYPVILTQLGLGKHHANSSANCYILRIADGSFIIYDTPHGSAVNNRTIEQEIYDLLKKQAPDPNNVVITAWFTSHPHNDHMQGLVKFANKYSADPTITVKQFVQNLSDETTTDAESWLLVEEMFKAFRQFPNAEHVKPHTGNVLHYPGVKFNVLYTQEEQLNLNQGGLYYYTNSTSMVTQMVTDDGCTVLFGGDSPQTEMIWQNKAMTFGSIYKWYGTFIESDVLTYFHHGLGSGGTVAANEVIKPKIVLWPITWGRMYAGTAEDLRGLYDYLQYFTDGLTEGVLHETPNENGVYGYFVADDNVHVLTFKDGKVSVDVYDTVSQYHNS